MPSSPSLSMSATSSNFLTISTGLNHVDKDCEVKTPQKEERRVRNNDAPVGAQDNVCVEDVPVGDEANACAENEILCDVGLPVEVWVGAREFVPTELSSTGSKSSDSNVHATGCSGTGVSSAFRPSHRSGSCRARESSETRRSPMDRCNVDDSGRNRPGSM